MEANVEPDIMLHAAASPPWSLHRPQRPRRGAARTSLVWRSRRT